MSEELRVLASCLRPEATEDVDKLALIILTKLNDRGWFLVPNSQVNGIFTDEEMDHIQELAQADLEDSQDEAHMRWDERDWGGLARWSNRLAMDQEIDKKIRKLHPDPDSQ